MRLLRTCSDFLWEESEWVQAMNLCDHLPMRMSIRTVVVAGICAASVVAINSPANADTNRAPHSPIASPAPPSSTSSTPGSQGAAPSPTASPATTASPSKRHILTPDQKVALAAAQSSYATAVANARDGFSRAVADAKSVMDQSIAAAGKDKAAIAQISKIKDIRKGELMTVQS